MIQLHITYRHFTGLAKKKKKKPDDISLSEGWQATYHGWVRNCEEERQKAHFSSDFSYEISLWPDHLALGDYRL